jgi:hypothetical protein
MVCNMFERAMEIGCVVTASIIKNVILNALCLPLELSRQCIHGVDPLVAMITLIATVTVVATASRKGWEGLSIFFSFTSSLMSLDNLGDCKKKDEQDDCDCVPPLLKIVSHSLNLDGNNGCKDGYGDNAHTYWFRLNLKIHSKD